MSEDANTKRRRSGIKSVSWAVSALNKPRKSKPWIDVYGTYTMKSNGRVSKSAPPDVSLIQTAKTSISRVEKIANASRDGLLDIVKTHLEASPSTQQLHTFDEDGYTALHHAARYNRVTVLTALIEAGANVNVKGGHDEVTPLHLACRYDSGSATQNLLARGAEVNTRDIKGKTPLHYATRRGHSTVTKMLLSVSNCDVNIADSDLITPLIMAAMEGNVSTCELLVSRGAEIGRKDINDMTPLMWASSEGHAAVVLLFLKAAHKHGEKYERQYVKASDNEGNTALHLAVQNGCEDVCNLLLNHFAEVNCIKFSLATPLHVAASNGYLDIAKLLIFHGADVNRKDTEQMTPIHKAALYNKVDLIKLHMKHGGDINAKDKKNMQPLHHACWKGQSDAVEYLLDNGAMISEADSSLKTPLHWTVQFGHYETLVVLLKHGGVNILEATDKNDQTALHYAAYFGNVSVLKTLLEADARPDAKDQEERTPLHIAAQYDNVSCVEALIQASNHETNDDDVDGRTPLLLASLYGHHQVVQVLLSLGAEVQKRDDEHCTSLMLAATHGHPIVIRCLLDNQANVNDLCKNKNTALHYACAGGHVDAVQLLLDKRADVTLKNTHDQAPLDLAIDNLHSDVGVAMLKHRSWRDSMGVRDQYGFTPMDRLIAKLPDAAMVVLDHCVERTTRDDDDPTLTMVFDYQYIDPGPDDPSCDRNKYFALNTMVDHDNDILLSHLLCQNILSQKWVRFGRRTFYWNLVVYILYLLFLNLYVISVDEAISSDYYLDQKNKCPIMNWVNMNQSERNRSLLHGEKNSEQLRSTIGKKTFYYGLLSQLFVVLIILKEAFKIYSQRLRYLFNLFNWIAWILFASTFAFTYPGNQIPCLYQWRAGWIATFFAWINFIMYLRRIDTVGIYVIMFVTVLISLMKAILLFLFFSWAFASAFYILMSGDKENKLYDDGDDDLDDGTTYFQPILIGVLNVLVMSLGELQPMREYLKISPNEFEYDVLILMSLFLFLMPIVLMNLLIGIAVGDIEKVQHNAYLKRIALQVDILYQLENNMPKFLQRKTYIRRATVKPNERKTTAWFDKIRRFLFGSTRDVQFIQKEQKDKMHHMLDRLTEQVNSQQQKMKGMNALLQEQTILLQHIGHKLNITDADMHAQDHTGLDASPFCDQFDHNSMYDNVSLGKLNQRGRYKSVRVTGMDRPTSVII